MKINTTYESRLGQGDDGSEAGCRETGRGGLPWGVGAETTDRVLPVISHEPGGEQQTSGPFPERVETLWSLNVSSDHVWKKMCLTDTL